MIKDLAFKYEDKILDQTLSKSLTKKEKNIFGLI